MQLCGVPTRNSAPIWSSTQNRNSARAGASVADSLSARSRCDVSFTFVG